MSCDSTDFEFPMLADVYYATTQSGAYGDIVKAWVFDRTVAGNFVNAGAKNKEEVEVDVEMFKDTMLLARTRQDIRVDSSSNGYDITNVIITNIRNPDGTEYYTETSGSRKNDSTLFEIATQQPFVGPFNTVEHYRLVMRRTENQGLF